MEASSAICRPKPPLLERRRSYLTLNMKSSSSRCIVCRGSPSGTRSFVEVAELLKSCDETRPVCLQSRCVSSGGREITYLARLRAGCQWLYGMITVLSLYAEYHMTSPADLAEIERYLQWSDSRLSYFEMKSFGVARPRSTSIILRTKTASGTSIAGSARTCPS